MNSGRSKHKIPFLTFKFNYFFLFEPLHSFPLSMLSERKEVCAIGSKIKHTQYTIYNFHEICMCIN